MSRNMRFAVVAIGIIIALGVVVSQFASSSPDGLEFVAEQEGFAETAEDHTLDGAPLADYGTKGSSRAIAAAVGIVVTLGVGFVLFKVISSPNTTSAEPQGRDDG